MPKHHCDAGDFSRMVCPEPCGTMHSYCSTCGSLQDECPNAGLALIPPQRCAPSEDEVARAIVRASGLEWHFNPDDPEDTYRCDARAVLVLLGDQPTVTQAKAEGIREACDHVAGMLARQDADAPFSIRVTDSLEALARQVESGAEHG